MVEDQMFEDLEEMLGQNTAAPPNKMQSRSKGVKVGSAKGLGSARRSSNHRIVPIPDLDDLEDNSVAYKRPTAPVQQRGNNLPPRPRQGVASNVFKKDRMDDIDDELDDVYTAGHSRHEQIRGFSGAQAQQQNGSATFLSSDPIVGGADRITNNAGIGERETMEKPKPITSALDDLDDLQDLMEGGEEEPAMLTVKEVLQQAFNLVFKDDFTSFPVAISHAFNSTVQSTSDTRRFLQSEEEAAIELRYEILYAAKLAVHLSMDKFVMADFDMEQGAELQVSLRAGPPLTLRFVGHD